MLCYIPHDYVIKHMIMLCYITNTMLCYNTHVMLHNT